MKLDNDFLTRVFQYTGLPADKLEDMYAGAHGEDQQLLAHALCSVPLSFYEELIAGKKNKVCALFECLSEEKINKIFGKALMNRYRRSDKYALMFKALSNMPECHIDGCRMSITIQRQRVSMFVSVCSDVCDDCLLIEQCGIPKECK